MRGIDHHEAWEMKPRKLSVEETEQPELVIEGLYQYASLPQLRWYLWEGTKTLVTGTFNGLRSRERTNLIYFYEQIERLIEVSYIMHERSKRAK